MLVFIKIYSPFDVLLISKVYNEKWTCFSKSVQHFTCCWCQRKWITHISFETFHMISSKTLFTKQYCIFKNKRNVRCTVLHTSITDLRLKWSVWLRRQMMERRAHAAIGLAVCESLRGCYCCHVSGFGFQLYNLYQVRCMK